MAPAGDRVRARRPTWRASVIEVCGRVRGGDDCGNQSAPDACSGVRTFRVSSRIVGALSAKRHAQELQHATSAPGARVGSAAEDGAPPLDWTARVSTLHRTVIASVTAHGATMTRGKRSAARWSWTTGERGVNRVRLYEHASSGMLYVEWYEARPAPQEPLRRARNLGYTDR